MASLDWYPLKLEPTFQERVWGQEQISDVYPARPPHPSRVGEVWLTADENRIVNGSLAGKTLGELCLQDSAGLLGAPAKNGGSCLFPLLVKFLFTSEKLSVQVHPSDAYAEKHEGGAGKTEMWHVLKAEPDAGLAIGFHPDTPGEQLDPNIVRNSIETGAIEHMLNRVNAEAGDSFFIAPGTVHALGAGITVCEIQQNSDVTYRLYDYGRLGMDGKPRALHIEKALSVLDMHSSGSRIQPLEYRLAESTGLCLAACPYFITDKINLKEPMKCSTAGKFEIWIGLEGEATLDVAGQRAVCGKGEAVVIPAAAKSFSVYSMNGSAFLRTRPPSLQNDVLSQWRGLGFSVQELKQVCFCPEPKANNL